MLSYIFRRCLLAIVTMFAVSFLAFVVVLAPPGDYSDFLYSHCNQESVKWIGPVCNTIMDTPEDIELVRSQLGLDRPLLVRYWNWIYPMVTEGDFGISQKARVFRPAADFIWEALPPTVYLALLTILITWTVAIPIGIYSAVRQHSVGDYVFTFLGFTGLAVPDFLLALVVMYLLFAYFEMSVGALHSGPYELAPWSVGKVLDMIAHLLIPAAVLGTAGTAALIRIMRNNLLDELNKPYVVAAQARGLSTWKVVLKYPLRVAINPFISSVGFILPSLISGSVILSVVMGLPTLGRLLWISIDSEDVWLAGDIILILGLLTIIGTLISDILLIIVDPRIKVSGREYA